MAESTSHKSSRVWLITGSSSGFGKIFVSEISARGDRVIATAWNISKLLDFAHSDNVKLLELDTTESHDSLDEKVSEAIGLFGQVDVLVKRRIRSLWCSGRIEVCDSSFA